MRWEIKTETKEVQGSKPNEIEKIKTTTKTKYITVGDIVGSAKSALGAVKNLVRTIPNFISMFKGEGNMQSANLAQTVLNIATPLATIIQGTEVYKKIMTVINVLTPIMKLVARGTGVWCSPGNAADMAQIILGTVQQILIAIITQIIIALKDWVWNFEFSFKPITESSSKLITRNLKSSGLKINNKVASSLNSNDLNLPPDGSGVDPKYADLASRLSDIYKQLGVDVTSEGTAGLVAALLIESGNKVVPTYNTAWTTIYYLKDGEGKDTSHLRQFRGSSNDCGIQYSTIENGNIVWKNSGKTDGSFCCFGKLTLSTGTIYVAGSEPFLGVNGLVNISDTEWGKDTNNHYNEDYYTYNSSKDLSLRNLNYHKIQKYKKDSKDLNTFSKNVSTSVFSPSPIKHPDGIWFSLDNGLTWTQATAGETSLNIQAEYIGGFFEYLPEDGKTATLVAASYDYNGLYYSQDGKTWKRSKVKGDGDSLTDLNHDRFVNLYDYLGEKIRITTNDIEATATVEATAYVLSFVETNNAEATATIEADIETPDGEANKKWLEINDYIHLHYADACEDTLDANNGAFWIQLKEDVYNGTYTIENAKRGDRIV